MADGSRFHAALPVVLAALAVGAILSEPLPIPLQHLGEVTGDPEKDSYGRDLTGRAATPPAPLYSRTPQRIGFVSGDPEKDTFGFIVQRNRNSALAALD